MRKILYSLLAGLALFLFLYMALPALGTEFDPVWLEKQMPVYAGISVVMGTVVYGIQILQERLRELKFIMK